MPESYSECGFSLNFLLGMGDCIFGVEIWVHIDLPLTRIGWDLACSMYYTNTFFLHSDLGGRNVYIYHLQCEMMFCKLYHGSY